MVDVRATNARVMVEDEPDSIDVRATNARVMVEDKDTTIYVRVTNTRIMIESHGQLYAVLAKTEDDDTLSATAIVEGRGRPVKRTMTPTHFSQLGISIYITDPLWK